METHRCHTELWISDTVVSEHRRSRQIMQTFKCILHQTGRQYYYFFSHLLLSQRPRSIVKDPYSTGGGQPFNPPSPSDDARFYAGSAQCAVHGAEAARRFKP